jgi:uncharacterized membrane protein
MDSKKGQVSIGSLIIVAVTLIVGVIFLVSIAQQVGTVTSTEDLQNVSLGTAVNGTTLYLSGYRLVGSPVIVNSTNGAVVGSGNYTLTNNVVNNGALTVSVLPTLTATPTYLNAQWNISGTAQPTTYIADSGGRALASLIVILFALAVLVVALVPSVRDGMKQMVGK